MERGSVIDAQLELQYQVAKYYQQQIGRIIPMPMFEDKNEKELYNMWMTPNVYAISKIKPRGCSLFIPSFESLLNKRPFDEYGQVINSK